MDILNPSDTTNITVTQAETRETLSVNNFPYIQSTATYNFLPSNFRSFTLGSGSTAVENRLMKTSTGTSVGGYGAIQSFRSLNYKSGINGICKFGAIFETGGIANSWQGVGLGNIGDELSFGYNGTSFGVWHRYNGESHVVTLTLSAAASGSETVTLTLNGTGYSIPVTSGTTAHNAYEIQDWLINNQSVWVADQVDATVIISALSDGAKTGTYSISSTGTVDGSFATNTTGVTKTSDFVAQADWNQNTVSWLDPTKGNIYQINYKYMGFGNINYFVRDPDTDEDILVHRIKEVNTSTIVTLSNSSLRTLIYCVSLGSTTNITVGSPSISAFLQGTISNTRNPRAYSFTRSINSSTFTSFFTIRNRRTYNGIVNQIEIEPVLLTIGSESSKNLIVEVRATSDTGIEENFTNVGTNLISDVSTTGITFTGGRLLAVLTLGASSRTGLLNLLDLRIRVPPSLKLIISGKLSGGAAADVTASLTWYEDI